MISLPFTDLSLTTVTIALAAALPVHVAAEATIQTQKAMIDADGRPVLIEQIQFLEDSGAANRIVAGDLLRTLSQEIPSSVCHLHNGIDVEGSIALLTSGTAKFDAVADALLNGNADMGIVGGEERRRTAVEIEALIASWEPIRDAAIAVLNDPSDAASAMTVYDSTDVMLEKTSHLLSELEGEYANPVELMQSDVMLLEVAGRQAMMTQRISYEACRIWSGDGNDALVADLDKTVQQFAFAMNAMSNGMPEVGINPPPTPEIAAHLAVVGGDWDTITGYLETVKAGEADAELRAELFQRLNAKMHKMEEIAELYAAFSKRGY